LTAKPQVPKREKVISYLLGVALVGFVLLVVVGSRQAAITETGELGQTIRLGPPWMVTEGWDSYSSDRLYEKINGRAVLFQEYGLVRLDFATVSANTSTFDVYVYRMGDADGALGVYLAEASQDSTPVDLGVPADRSGGLVRAVAGRTYLVVMPLEQDGDATGAVKLAAAILPGAEPRKAHVPGVIDLLPKAGRVKGTLSYNKESAFGLKSLHDMFSCAYAVDGVEFEYLLRRAADGRARAVLAAVRDELQAFGGSVMSFASDGLSGTLFDRRIVLVSRNGMILGIYGQLSQHEAKRHLNRLVSEVANRSDDR